MVVTEKLLLLQPLHTDLEVLMDLAVEVTNAISAMLHEQSGPSTLRHLVDRISSLSMQR